MPPGGMIAKIFPIQVNVAPAEVVMHTGVCVCACVFVCVLVGKDVKCLNEKNGW